jgi:hypothetical protein
MTTIVYPALFDTLIGETMSHTAIAALGSIGTNYINTFATAEENQWLGYAASGAALPANGGGQHVQFGYYYGRDICNFSCYKMGGYSVAKHLDRGVAWAADYFSWYQPNTDALNEYVDFTRSMAVYYAVSGLETVRTAIGRHCTLLNRNVSFNQIELQCYGSSVAFVQNTDHIEPTTGRPAWQAGSADPRTKARELEGLVTAHMINAPLVDIPGQFTAPTSWAAAALNCLNKILAAQDPTGIWREAYPSWRNGTPGYSQSGVDGWGTVPSPWPSDHPRMPVKSFEVGLVNDAMMLYDRVFPGDARILPSILASMTYLMNGGSWAGNQGPLWHTPTKGWRYLEFNGGWEPAETYVGVGSIPVSPALNGLILTGAAWLYKKTGDAYWKTVAEEAMTSFPINLASSDVGALSGTPTYALKLINQNYSRSFEAWPQLYGAPAPSSDPHKIRGKWRNN